MTCGDDMAPDLSSGIARAREEREAEEREAFGMTCDTFKARVAHLRENDPAAFLSAIARLVEGCE